MLDLKKHVEGKTLVLELGGRLDTTTVEQFEKDVEDDLKSADKLVVDLADLTYISSAGLRALLNLRKAMDGKGGMVIRNATDSVRDILVMTGFINYFTVE